LVFLFLKVISGELIHLALHYVFETH